MRVFSVHFLNEPVTGEPTECFNNEDPVFEGASRLVGDSWEWECIAWAGSGLVYNPEERSDACVSDFSIELGNRYS